MTIQIASGGICAALFGKWTMKVGTRFSMTCGAALFGSAFALSALGVQMHSLPLLYAGNCTYLFYYCKAKLRDITKNF